MKRIIMNSKIKILIGVLVIGVLLIGGLWIWSEGKDFCFNHNDCIYDECSRHCINKYFPKSKCVMNFTPIERYIQSNIGCYCYENHCEEDHNAPCIRACEDWKNRNCTTENILPKQVFIAYDCDAKMDCKCVKDLFLKGIPIVESYQGNKLANFTVIKSGKHEIALKNTGNVTLTNIGIYLPSYKEPDKLELFRVFISLEPGEKKDIMGGVKGILTQEEDEKYKATGIDAKPIVIKCSQGLEKKFYWVKSHPVMPSRWW